MNLGIRLLTFILVSFSFSFGYAQSKKSEPAKATSLRMMQSKAHLEEMITERFRATIATSLDKSVFDVSVQVKLAEAPAQTKTTVLKSMSEASKPLDLTVGLVDADAIIRRYEQDLATMKEREAILVRAGQEPEFVVRTVTISVGLQPTLSKEYFDKFNEWLKNRVQAEFGSIGKSEVDFLQPAPDKKEIPKTLLDYLTTFQGLIGFAILAAALILVVLLFKFVGSKDALEERRLKAQLQQQQQMKLQQEQPREVAPLEEDKPALPEPPARDLSFELDVARELQAKIIWSSSENFQRLNEVLHGWLETGERGLFKAACLMDILISYGGKQGADRPLPFEWSMAVPPTFRKQMRQVFERMAALELPEKIRILEEVYWDLVSIKVLGANALAQPFQFVSAIPMSEMKTILAGQNPRMRTLVVLHMPEEQREDYFKLLPIEGKKEIFEQTIQMEQVLNTDIETASETLKFEVKKVGQGDARTVSLRSMAPKLLESMTVYDEIMLLKEISQKISDGAISLKQSFPSLAFIGEWPEAKAKLVMAGATTDEVLTFLRLMPELKEKILPVCAPRVQTIVQEELRKEDQTSKEAKEQHLGSLKLRLLQAVNKEGINLEEIFPSSPTTSGGLRAAS